MPRSGRRSQWLFAFFSALCGASIAHAQSKARPPAGYAEAVSQALDELEAANYPEALEEFRRAHVIFPNARTLRGLGMVEFELRHYAESCRLLGEALASRVKPLDGRQRAETEALLSRAGRYLGEVVLSVEPAFARVLVDGAPVDFKATPTLTLEVGQHVIEVRAAEYGTQRRELAVKGGERVRVHIVLERAALAAPIVAAEVKPAEPAPTPPPMPSPRNVPMLWAGGVLLGAGIASEVAGWTLFGSRVDKGEAVLRSVDVSRVGPWEDARAPMIGTAAAGGVSASVGTALLVSAVAPNKVPWWLAGTVGAIGGGLAAWGAVDLAKGANCTASDARACVQDEQRQDRGVLLLCSAAPLMTVLVTRGFRSAVSQDSRVDVTLSLGRATLSGTW